MRANQTMLCGLLVVAAVSAVASGDEVDRSRRRLEHTLNGHRAGIAALAVSPDGEQLVSASYDQTLRIWDISTGAQRRMVTASSRHFGALQFSPDGRMLAAGDGDKIVLWEATSGKRVTQWNDAFEVTALAFSPTGDRLVSANRRKQIILWDTATGEAKPAIESGHRTFIRRILFSPDGKVFATTGYYDVHVWTASGDSFGKIDGRASDMRFSADGATLTVAIGHRVTHWNLASQQSTVFTGDRSVPYQQTRGILSPDGDAMASLDRPVVGVDLGRGVAPIQNASCRLVLMDARTGQERTLGERSTLASPQRFSPDGREIVVRWHDEELYTILEVTSGAVTRLTPPDAKLHRPGRVPPVIFTPDGKTLATTSGPQIFLWKAR